MVMTKSLRLTGYTVKVVIKIDPTPLNPLSLRKKLYLFEN